MATLAAFEAELSGKETKALWKSLTPEEKRHLYNTLHARMCRSGRIPSSSVAPLPSPRSASRRSSNDPSPCVSDDGSAKTAVNAFLRQYRLKSMRMMQPKN